MPALHPGAPKCGPRTLCSQQSSPLLSLPHFPLSRLTACPDARAPSLRGDSWGLEGLPGVRLPGSGVRCRLQSAGYPCAFQWWWCSQAVLQNRSERAGSQDPAQCGPLQDFAPASSTHLFVSKKKYKKNVFFHKTDRLFLCVILELNFIAPWSEPTGNPFP